MGVINITQRSERLGNLGGTSAAHGVTNTDIGQVRHAVARTFSPHYYNRNSHAGDGAIADGLGKIGDTLVRIGAAVVQREEDRKVDDYANAMLDSMEKQGRDDRDIDDWNTPDRKHLQGQKRGFYLRTGEGTKTVVDEWDRAFADTFRKIGDSIDANDRVRERTMDKLANYRRATVSRLADNQAAEYRRMEMDSAKGNLSSQIALWKNGRTEVLPDIFAQQERVDNLSLATPEKRKANREALALKLTSDFVGNSLDQCQTPEDFDKVEEAVRGGLKDALPDLIADNLPGGRTVDGETKKALLGEVKKARQSFEIQRDREEREMIGEISNFSTNALARGGIDDLESALKAMNARAAQMPKGSRLETVALQEAKRLDKAADAEAKRLTWDAIIDHAGDGSKWEPPKGSRMAKYYKELKESFDRQAQAYMAEGMLAAASTVQEERKANVAALRASMLEAVAVDPGGFSARLAEAAEKGHVTLDQYRMLRDEFRDVWTKEGMPQKGAALVQILKNEFYAGKDYDLNDRLAVNPKTGRFEYVKDPDTKKPFEGEDVEFKAQVFVPYSPNDWYGWRDFLFPGDRAAHYETTTRTFTSDEQLKMLDWAMELAQHDGEWISTDPQTGAKLDKPRKLDAVAEFQDACSRMRTSKRAEASQELVVERAKAMISLRAGFAQSDDAVTGTAAKREAVELKTRETLKSMKRKPFAPKMPGVSRGESAASDGEED